ncbi:MAG: hypothetical protein ABIQ07_10455 [Ginsengibacter sp.]
MKKVFLALALASVFAACNDSKTDSTTATDSTTVKVDTSVVTPVDTSANKMMADTTKK